MCSDYDAQRGREKGRVREEWEDRHPSLTAPSADLICANTFALTDMLLVLFSFYFLALRIRHIGRSLAITITLLNVPNLCSHLLQQHLGACSPPTSFSTSPSPSLSRILKLFRQKSNELERQWQQLLQLRNNNNSNEPLPCLLPPPTASPSPEFIAASK